MLAPERTRVVEEGVGVPAQVVTIRDVKVARLALIFAIRAHGNFAGERVDELLRAGILARDAELSLQCPVVGEIPVGAQVIGDFVIRIPVVAAQSGLI